MDQDRQVLIETIEESLKSSFYNRKEISHELKRLEVEVISGKISPYLAAKELLDRYFGNRDS
jgi:LAO/AO transport system kinase